MERLQKLLARAGVASRRAAERLIADGRVSVNGRVVCTPGTTVDARHDAVRVDGRSVRAPREPGTYLMLHKPKGFVTTLDDPEGRPTVAQLVGPHRGRLFPVGRLDFHSEGLLLLTDDGELARDLMHPARRVEKVYAVKVQGTPDDEALDRVRDGRLVLDGRRAARARVRVVRAGRNAWCEVVVTEGRKHHVRRLFAAIGHRVRKLKRVAYGGVRLGELPPGAVRRLTRPEIARLRAAAGHAAPRRAVRARGRERSG